LDRVAVAQTLLGGIRWDWVQKIAGGAATRAVVGSLASEWPEDYPAGAVERLLAGA